MIQVRFISGIYYTQIGFDIFTYSKVNNLRFDLNYLLNDPKSLLFSFESFLDEISILLTYNLTSNAPLTNGISTDIQSYLNLIQNLRMVEIQRILPLKH